MVFIHNNFLQAKAANVVVLRDVIQGYKLKDDTIIEVVLSLQ